MHSISISEDILFKYFRNRASEEECKAISVWLDEKKDNQMVFLSFKKIFVDMANDDKKNEVDTENAYDRFKQRIKDEEVHYRLFRRSFPKKLRSDLLRYAAVGFFILALTIGAFYIGTYYSKKPGESICIIEVPYGGKSNITLPDGTKVWLNAGSKLSYNQLFFSDSRNVTLEGEAYFDVEKNKLPFIVHTSHLDVHALGTIFNVKSYPDEDRIEMILVEGSIKIEREDANQPLYLKPHEKLTFHKATSSYKEHISKGSKAKPKKPEENLSKKQVLKPLPRIEIIEGINTDDEISWKDGNFIIESKTLEHLCKILERKYDIAFEFEDENLKNYSYSGTIRDFPLEQVLRALELTSPVKCKIQGKKVLLSQNNKNINYNNPSY